MKKIILLSLMMCFWLCGVRGQIRIYGQYSYTPYDYNFTYCNSSLTIEGYSQHNTSSNWVLTSSKNGDTIYTPLKLCRVINGAIIASDTGNYIITGDTFNTIYISDSHHLPLYNLPIDTYGVKWWNFGEWYSYSFSTIECLNISGDSLGNIDTSLIYCGDSLKLTNINIDSTYSKWEFLSYNKDSIQYSYNNDSIKRKTSIGVFDTTINSNSITYYNLSPGYDTIICIGYGEYDLSYGYDTIIIKIEDCLIDAVDTLSESIINNKNCVDGDSILNFKFNFTNNQNSDTDYYFNYSKFQWVIKDSIGKTVDSLVTKDDDEIFLNSLSGLKGNDTLYCTAMSEYFDTTVSISFTVNPYPTLNISLQDTSINLGDSVQLIASSNGSVIWSPSTGLSCTNCSNPIASPSMTTTYTATATEGSCEVSDTVTITVITTGINQQSVKNNNLSIYPNPSAGQFKIQLNSNKNDYTVEIYNVLGEKIYYSVLNNTHSNIDLSSHPAGVYFVYLKSKEDVNVEKVLITK